MKMFAKVTDIFVPMAVGKNSLAKSLTAAFCSMRIWGRQVCHYKSFRMLCILYLFPPPVVYLFIGSLRPLRRGSSFLEVFFLL